MKERMTERLLTIAERASKTADAVWKEPLTAEQLRKYVKDTNDHIANLCLEIANTLQWTKLLTLEEYNEGRMPV